MAQRNRCKTCGTPLDEVPFGPCEEHATYESLQPMMDITDDEAFEIAYQDAMEEAYRYGGD